jgi:hypothetical protein
MQAHPFFSLFVASFRLAVGALRQPPLQGVIMESPFRQPEVGCSKRIGVYAGYKSRHRFFIAARDSNPGELKKFHRGSGLITGLPSAMLSFLEAWQGAENAP